jgi:hypothetical protein
VAEREPFSRRRSRDGERERDDFDLARAVEFLADAYGWTLHYIDGELTDEQFVLYLDAADERIKARDRRDMHAWVEAARMGTFFGSGTKEANRAYTRWKARMRNADGGRGLTGAALEQAIRALAGSHPEYVVMGAG